MTTIAILLIVLGGGAIWWRNHKRKSAADEAMPVGQETLANRFPGFEIAPQDFVAIDGQLHRVNADGSRHSLKEWHFDRATGEFYRITGEDRDSVYFDQMRYSERLIDVRRGKDGQAIVKIQLAFFRLAAMAILGLAILSMGVVGATGDGRQRWPRLFGQVSG